MKPFSDVTVVELCREGTPVHLRLAMAMTGRLIADQGARLLCVVSGPDRLEHVPPFLDGGISSTYAFLTVGKEIVALSGEAATEGALAAQPVAVILAEGDVDRDRFAAAGIAVVELANWPKAMAEERAGEPVNDFTLAASAGFLDVVGEPGRAPLRLGGHQLSYSAGMSAFTALTAAVVQRDLDGRVLHARVSLLETAVWMNWKAIVGADGPGSHTTRAGNDADFPVLRCKDGWAAFVYTPNQFERLEGMFSGLPIREMKGLPPEERSRWLKAAVEPWFAERTRAEVYAAAREFGIPVGPVYAPGELLEDEQYLARDFFTGSPGTLRFPRPPMTWNGARLESRPAPVPAHATEESIL